MYFKTIQDLLFICVDQANAEFADYSCHYFGQNGNTVPRFLAHFWSTIIIFLVSQCGTVATLIKIALEFSTLLWDLSLFRLAVNFTTCMYSSLVGKRKIKEKKKEKNR